MTTYTVIGLYVDNHPVVAAVIEGNQKCVDHDTGFFLRWADPIDADDPEEAEAIALSNRRED